ncbi:MAG: carbamoyl phosphate synthase small subunit, partial [Clostridia bacterium]|nr:carbamoyl phosphate synthase small subunit [Clostridia bacterium]
MKRTAYLVLENGKTFKGSYFGAQNEITAEIVFFTGMVGYLSVLTDKSYKDKMVVATFPVAGNYGIIPSNFESDIAAPAAYIVKSWCQLPSNFRSEGDIDAFFVSKVITGLCDIDTRTLTEILRENGKMN